MTRASLAALACLALLSYACHAEPDDPVTQKPGQKKPVPAASPPCSAAGDPLLEGVYHDDFERTALGAEDWLSTSYGAYDIRGSRLCTDKPRNHPLWLKRRLPTNVRIEFTATPMSNDIDVKAELFGDGCSFDVGGGQYRATGYVGVLGAHKNTEDWLARLSEHGTDLHKTQLVPKGSSIANSKLVANSTYHVELSRTDGHEVKFLVDGVVIHTFPDDAPLLGNGHDHFGFNGWEAPVCFDSVVVTPLPN